MDRIEALGEVVLKWLRGELLSEDEVTLLASYDIFSMKPFIEKCVNELRDPLLIGIAIIGYCATKGGSGKCGMLYNGVAQDDEYYALLYYRKFIPPSCIPYGADIRRLNRW
jgi:hypothetical protein